MVLISQVTMKRAGIETLNKTNHGVLKIYEHTPDTNGMHQGYMVAEYGILHGNWKFPCDINRLK